MRGEDQRRGEAVEKSRILRKDAQRVRIRNRRAVGAAQYIPGKRSGLWSRADAGADRKSACLLKRPFERIGGQGGEAPVLRGEHGQDHRSVTARGRDGIDALRYHELRKTRTAALAGVGGEDRRAAVAPRARDDQSAAIAVLVADARSLGKPAVLLRDFMQADVRGDICRICVRSGILPEAQRFHQWSK